MQYVLTLMLLASPLLADAQLKWKKIPVYKVNLTGPEYSTQAEVARENPRIDPKLRHTYYWIRSQEIHHSRGDFGGRLLHGEYAVFYRSQNLKEKGFFHKGLKSGQWKKWHISGELNEVQHYKHGRKHGVFLVYSATGKPKTQATYKNGKLHGKYTDYKGSLPHTIVYKKGKVMPLKAPKTGDNASKAKEQTTKTKTREKDPVRKSNKKPN